MAADVSTSGLIEVLKVQNWTDRKYKYKNNTTALLSVKESRNCETIWLFN